MKTEKNKYKEKDTQKRRKEWDKIRRETNNEKWMLWVWTDKTQISSKISLAMTTRNTFSFFYITFFFKKKVINNNNLIIT